ncbi:MAG: excinuclease ABC subunit UvrC [Lachnospiraceae bacterium]|nr:excinuclease ABC subunit UvrC [Lachnospiraceae bacterium]
MFDIQEELKKLPASPGVYIMHDKKDDIIYVGKAISLKNRVRQYFQASTNKSPKIEKMVTNIARFEYIVTDSELEALILECNLIKEHRPKYNTMLKDDKGYPFIRVTLNEPYPRIKMARKMSRDKAKYFGPYPSVGAVNSTIDLLTKLYQIRTCNRQLPKDIGKDRPCLNYHIKQCDAPCMGYINQEDYKQKFESVISFLNGNYEPVTKMLEEKMYAASEEMKFEEAMQYRDLLTEVKKISLKQKINTDEFEDRDIIAYSKEYSDAVIQVFFIRNGKMLGREHFHINIAPEDEESELLSVFIKQYYSGSPFIPRQLLLQEDVKDKELIEQWLAGKRGGKVSLLVPKRGEKEKLVELAKKNASMVLEKDREKLKREEIRTTGAVNEITNLIGIEYAYRIEAYDISNTNGFESVGSMIVYEDGKPKRREYRKFKIKTVTGPDDYSSMREVLTRRFTHGIREQEELKEQGLSEQFGKFNRFPDLIMMDGGRGQVNIALGVLKELGLNIPVCGMVKDDYHRTRGLYFNNTELPINAHSEGFRLITRIQDEAHRFAIEYHKSIRSKEQVHSILDDIEGIGPGRRKALLKYFRSLEAIKAADVETLKNIPSMNETAARNVKSFFSGNNE